MSDDTTKLLNACVEYRAMVDKLEAENAALREALASAEVGLKHALMMEPGDPFKRIKAITAALDAVRAAKKEAQP